jgi:peroxiredoxin
MQIRQYRTAGALLLLGGGLAALLQPRLQAQDAAAAARNVIAAIATEEARGGTGRATLAIQDRRGPYVGSEKREDTEKRLKAEAALLAEGTVLYSPEGWLKELSVAASAVSPSPSRTRTGEAGGVFRFLVETSADGKQQARALLNQVTGTSPGDAILAGRVARSLDGVEWSALKQTGALVTLTGMRGGERHVLNVFREPHTAVQSWELSRTTKGPDGRASEQSYTVEVTRDAQTGVLQRVKEWSINRGAEVIAFRDTEVKKVEAVAGVPAASLLVPLPKGALVRDLRTGSPVDYELLEGDEGRTAPPTSSDVGKPAPPVELKSTQGKPIRLERDKPIVLLWFSSDSPPAEGIAKAADAISDNYRKQGVQFVGLEISREGDAGKQAEAFGKSSKWSFPLGLDPGAELMGRFGIQKAVPAVAVIDRQGKLLYARTGLDPVTLTAALDTLKK